MNEEKNPKQGEEQDEQAQQAAVAADVDTSTDAPETEEAGDGRQEQEGVTDETAALLEKLDEATAEIEKQRNHYARAMADLENYRRRVAREKEDLRKYAASSLVEDLLPALDNLRLAIESSRQHHPEAKGVIDGVDMVLKQMVNALGEHGVQPVDPGAGEAFDPNQHEAVSQAPSAEVDEGKVLQVTRVGYKLNDRLVRPASVIVSAGPATEEE